MVYKKDKVEKAQCLEIKFKAENFLHLTGLITKLSANDFYNNAINSKLSESKFKTTEYTEMKLRALGQLLNIEKTNCQIGHYKGNRPYLQADMIVGKSISILGLVEVGKFHIPRTVLEESIPNIIQSPQPTIAIFKKRLGINEKYKETYRNLKYDTEVYMNTLSTVEKSKIDFDFKEE